MFVPDVKESIKKHVRVSTSIEISEMVTFNKMGQGIQWVHAIDYEVLWEKTQKLENCKKNIEEKYFDLMEQKCREPNCATITSHNILRRKNMELRAKIATAKNIRDRWADYGSYIDGYYRMTPLFFDELKKIFGEEKQK